MKQVHRLFNLLPVRRGRLGVAHRVGLLAVLALLLSACLPLSTPFPTPTITPAPPSITPTATVLWFPPTATATRLPSATAVLSATLQTTPVPGVLLYSDDFSSAGKWTLGRTSTGSALLGKNELTIAIARPRGYVYSLLEEPALGDFLLEISASPNICRGEDEYGLLLRVSQELDYYRYGLTCDGQARVDRIYHNQASSPQAPVRLAAIPAGAPSTARLAVSAEGQTLRFFVNGELLFSVRDSLLYNGRIGVFARAAGADAVTINFTNLNIYANSP